MTFRNSPSTRDIVDLSVDAEATWYPVPLDRSEQLLWGETLAAEVTGAGSSRRTLGSQLEALQIRLIGSGNPRMSCAVWIPYPETGRASSALAFQLTDLPAGTAEAAADSYLAELRADEGRRTPGIEYLSVTTWQGEVAAGPFVAAHNLIALRNPGDDEAVIEERTVFAVFPPGAAQMVQLVFSAESVGAFVNMPRQTEEVVAALRIELEATA
ncbi:MULTISPECIES: hypothetical protein [Cryobacterium]|uniref:Uncharacterized protein n=1 Tax=Cryobacterium zongtaii TaxID=1259217 RepID=A0A2S3ZMQ3_9MICO|nr:MULTISPECIES: hypothetical protein [Cryobacterium]POH68491.1 hypothetical protein C3B60_04670 [Cryobacterium zongtaii]POH70108.1 hypothetical protein C3B61_00355 [Cryobacterium zongtaii]TFC49178.1 hypothetical protein E3O57_00495 [Cryobacterium sp. TMN-39-2]